MPPRLRVKKFLFVKLLCGEHGKSALIDKDDVVRSVGKAFGFALHSVYNCFDRYAPVIDHVSQKDVPCRRAKPRVFLSRA